MARFKISLERVKARLSRETRENPEDWIGEMKWTFAAEITATTWANMLT